MGGSIKRVVIDPEEREALAALEPWEKGLGAWLAVFTRVRHLREAKLWQDGKVSIKRARMTTTSAASPARPPDHRHP